MEESADILVDFCLC